MSTPLSFNANWYLSQNPDVAAAIQAGAAFNAFEHFTLYGRAENRSASPVFDAQEYLRNNPDVAEAVAQGLITAWDHFELFGGAEGRSPTPLFNEAFYLQQNPDVAAAVEQGIISSAAQHFALFGQSEPRAINPAINLGQYLNANPDIAQAAADGLINPLDHLMQYGVTEGRPLGNGVSLSDFASDPGFTQALTGGNPVQALIRVEAVAPFIPTFERPAGWTPPANTPIPVDFVPPADSGIKLVVPPEVVVPDDVELPDTFEPTTPEPTPDTGGGGGGGGGATFTVTTDEEGNLHFGGTAKGAVKFIVSEDGGIFEREGVQQRYEFTGNDKAILLNITSNGTIDLSGASPKVVTTNFSDTLVSVQSADVQHNTVFVGVDDASDSGAWSITKDGLNIVLDSNVTLTGGFDVSITEGEHGAHFVGGTIVGGASKDAVAGQHAIYVRTASDVSVTGMTFLSFIEERDPQARAIEVQDSVAAKVKVDSAVFDGWVTGIYVGQHAELSVADGTFVNNVVGIGTDGPDKLHVTGSMFDGNTVEDIGLTPKKIIGDADISGNTYTGGDTPAINNGTDTGFSELKGVNLLVGTINEDDLRGFDGAQTIFGSAGNDYITGDSANEDRGADTLVGGDGADWLRGGNGHPLGDNSADIIFAGSLTEIDLQTGLYAESLDAATDGWPKWFHTHTYNAWSNVFSDAGNANILEGNGGDDILVASDQKDVFLYKTRANGDDYMNHYGSLDTTAADALGTDTIHNFTVGVDKIAVVMDVRGSDHTFVADASGTHTSGQIYAQVNEDNGWSLAYADGVFTIAFDSSEYEPAGGGSEGNFSIKLVGVKGFDSLEELTVGDFFLRYGEPA